MSLANQFCEEGVAGSILLDERCLLDVRSILKSADFASISCAEIFKAACRLQEKGDPVDPVTVQADAAAHGFNLSADYLTQLMEFTPTAANSMEYAQLTKQASIRRSIQDIAETIIEQATDKTVDITTLLSNALDKIQNLSSGSRSSVITPEELAMDFLDYREKLESGEITPVVSTGYQKLDRVLGGGFVQSGLYILAARPGVGKTTLGLQIADRVSRSVPVLFVSLEMDEKQISSRRIAEQSAMSAIKIMHEPHVSDAERERICSAVTDMGTVSNLHMNAASSMTVEEIALAARAVPNIGLLVIDYLGLIKHEKGNSLYERTTLTSNSLKRVARSLKIPVLCLAQLNRESEHRQNKNPSSADLRDSGAIEQDADGIMLIQRINLYQDNPEQMNPAEKEIMEVNIAKNRHGSTGIIRFDFYPRNGRVRE